MSQTRRFLSFILVVAMVLSTVAIGSAASGYNDTTGHWAEKSISRWSNYNIVSGYNGAFMPDNSMTRGQLAKVIANMLGLTEEPDTNPFSDVDPDAWYAPYILRCYKAGIMLGANGKANPEATVSRQESVVMIARAFNIEPQTASLGKFSDAASVASWAAGYMTALINKGIVSGITADTLAPKNDINRASVMTIFDRAVVQYINKPGNYDLTDQSGIVLVASGEVKLTGNTKADILVAPGASNKIVNFDKAKVTGSITILADNCTIKSSGSTLPAPVLVGSGNKVVGATTAVSGGGSSSSSSSSGSTTTVVANTIIDTEKTMTGEANTIYKNVKITDAVGDGSVTLKDMTITDTLTIEGGGSHSVELDNCVINRIVINKNTTAGATESPRVNLVNGTDAPNVEVSGDAGAILESSAADSTFGNVVINQDVEVRGANTSVDKITVSETATTPVAVSLSGGASVEKVEAKGEAEITGAGNVAQVEASADVSVSADVVDKLTVQADSGDIDVSVSGTSQMELEVNGSGDVSVTATNAANITVSTDTGATGTITVNGNPVEHVHQWDEGEEITPSTCTQTGIKRFTCIAGCSPAAVKTEDITTKPHTLTAHAEVPATCTEAGVKAYWDCSVCLKLFSDADGKVEIAEPVTIGALGHDYGAWTKKDDTHHQRVCSRNANHIETAEHEWDGGEITTPATCTVAGVKTYKCTTCGATSTEAIIAQGHELVHHDAAEATRTTQGNIEFYSCNRCDTVFAADGTTEIEAGSQWIPAFPEVLIYINPNGRLAAMVTSPAIDYYGATTFGLKISRQNGSASHVVDDIRLGAETLVYPTGEARYAKLILRKFAPGPVTIYETDLGNNNVITLDIDRNASHSAVTLNLTDNTDYYSYTAIGLDLDKYIYVLNDSSAHSVSLLDAASGNLGKNFNYSGAEVYAAMVEQDNEGFHLTYIPVEMTVNEGPGLEAPTGLAWVNAGKTFTFDVVDGAAGYEIVCTDGNSQEMYSVTVDAETFGLAGVLGIYQDIYDQSGTYYIKVGAYSDANNKHVDNYSDPISIEYERPATACIKVSDSSIVWDPDDPIVSWGAVDDPNVAFYYLAIYAKYSGNWERLGVMVTAETSYDLSAWLKGGETNLKVNIRTLSEDFKTVANSLPTSEVDWNSFKNSTGNQAFNDLLSEVWSSRLVYPDSIEADGAEYVTVDNAAATALTASEAAILKQTRPFDSNVTVTVAQAKEDIDLLFRALHHGYSPYYFFGATAFNNAEANILAWIDEQPDQNSISAADLRDKLRRETEFMKDGHGWLGMPYAEMFGSYNTFISYQYKFEKDGAGYYTTINEKKYYVTTLPDGVSIERALFESGEIAYAPVAAGFVNSFDSQQITVKANDESTQTLNLSWSKLDPFNGMRTPGYNFLQDRGIAYISLRTFREDAYPEVFKQFEATGTTVKDSRLIIFDLRSNGGGNGYSIENWGKNFTGLSLAPTAMRYQRYSHIKEGNVVGLSEYYRMTPVKQFAEDNNIPVIILVDNLDGSAAEYAINLLKQIKNSIVIGSNTKGAQLAGNVVEIALPNSGISCGISTHFRFVNDLNNDDLVGDKPDVYCSPANVIDAIINMFTYYNLPQSETLNNQIKDYLSGN